MKTAADQIRAEIAERGAIPFERFMQLALYCPDCGYYEKEKDTTGHRGDFYTSVSVGSLFGELLAFQFSEWLEAEAKNQKSEVRIVEAGAHDGKLALDILNWLRLRRPKVFEQIEYWLIEPSARRQGWQRKTLDELGAKVRWFADLKSIPPGTIRGVIFSNELLDAMPVQRLGWDAKRREWFEWGVTADQGRFIWTRLPGANQDPDWEVVPPAALLKELPDGFTMESSPAAANWWKEAAQLLKRGKLLTLDYGLDAGDFISPQRVAGTLRAYHRHRLVDDVLANPGEQDLTAHVNFSLLKLLGERAGLSTEVDQSQAQFLTGIAQRVWKEGSDFGAWTSQHTRQFQTLTHPEHLGRAFRALVQSR